MVNSRMLKAAIIAAGYTQATLAERLNISANSLSSKITGKTKFDIEEATTICNILNIRDDEQKVNIFLA